jgi:hypothetical protein
MAHFFYEKIRRSAAPFWFELRDVGILQIFDSRAVLQRKIVDSPSEGIGGLDGFFHFLYEAAQKFESFQLFKIKIKKQKPIAVDVLIKDYLMAPETTLM